MADDEATAPGGPRKVRGSRQATTGVPGAAAKKAAARKTAAKPTGVAAPGPTEVVAPGPPAAAAPGAPVSKTRARKAPAGAAPARKAPARRPAPEAQVAPPVPARPPAKKAPARKAGAASKSTAKRAPSSRTGAVLAGAPAADPTLRPPLGAQRSFAGDWEEPPPAPEPVREDPAARMRAVLRAAAASLEARDAKPAPRVAPPVEPPPPPTAIAAPEEPPAPVTRVLIAPDPATTELSTVDFEEEVADEPGEDGDWDPPDVIDADEPPPAAPRTVATAPAYAPLPADAPAPLRPESPTPPPPPDAPEPPAWTPPSPATSGTGPRGGVALSLVAIALAVVVPLLGAIVGFVLANRARRRNAPLAGVARIVAVLAFAVWLVVAGIAGYGRIREGGVDYSKLKVGDCFSSSSSTEVRGVDVKPCSTPHNSEIFFLVTHPAGKKDAYPGRDALVQFAADACLGQPLTDYLGVPLEGSKLQDFEIVPQESAWKDGRRVLVCGIDTGGQGPIKGSVKGTRR